MKLIHLKYTVCVKSAQNLQLLQRFFDLDSLSLSSVLIYIQSSLPSIYLTASQRYYNTCYSYLPWAVISVSLWVFFPPPPARKQKTGCAVKGRKVALNILMAEL